MAATASAGTERMQSQCTAVPASSFGMVLCNLVDGSEWLMFRLFVPLEK